MILLPAALAPASAAPPAWWRALLRLERLESPFVQVSDSAVFGAVSRTGTLRLAKGGRLQVVYETGLRIAADGTALIQFDPGTRTAQRMDLQAAARETPLLALLLDPARIGQVFKVVNLPDGKIRLEPSRPGLPVVEAEGQGAFLQTLRWTDPTGARQVLRLTKPKVPAPFPAGTFSLKVPEGTRWLP